MATHLLKSDRLLSSNFAINKSRYFYMCINPNLITYRKVLAPLKDILMVDNQYDIVDVLQIRFQKEGFRVHGFTDPVSALGYLKSDHEKFALVITDMRMPGMSGIELLLKIRELCSDVKAFIVTAVDVDTIRPEIKRHFCHKWQNTYLDIDSFVLYNCNQTNSNSLCIVSTLLGGYYVQLQ